MSKAAGSISSSVMEPPYMMLTVLAALLKHVVAEKTQASSKHDWGVTSLSGAFI